MINLTWRNKGGLKFSQGCPERSLLWGIWDQAFRGDMFSWAIQGELKWMILSEAIL